MAGGVVEFSGQDTCCNFRDFLTVRFDGLPLIKNLLSGLKILQGSVGQAQPAEAEHIVATGLKCGLQIGLSAWPVLFTRQASSPYRIRKRLTMGPVGGQACRLFDCFFSAPVPYVEIDQLVPHPGRSRPLQQCVFEDCPGMLFLILQFQRNTQAGCCNICNVDQMPGSIMDLPILYRCLVGPCSQVNALLLLEIITHGAEQLHIHRK